MVIPLSVSKGSRIRQIQLNLWHEDAQKSKVYDPDRLTRSGADLLMRLLPVMITVSVNPESTYTAGESNMAPGGSIFSIVKKNST
jgi:hypothetical protein